MQSIKKFLFIMIVALGANAYSSSAQIYVSVHPPVPHYERVPAPSPRHVWIGEEWEPRGGSYVFVGGHWSEPPHPGWAWVPGHWRDTPRGAVWVGGHWRHR